MDNTLNEEAFKVAKDVVEAIDAGRWEEAFHLSDAGIKRGMQHPSLYNARAMWLSELGRYQEALVDFEQARAYYPQDAGLLMASGFCLLQLHRYGQAVRAFNAAIVSEPRLARAYYGLASALGSIGEMAPAEQALQKSIELDPASTETRLALGHALLRLGKPEEARRQAIELDALLPGNSASVVLQATADMDTKKHADAEERLKTKLADPDLGDDYRMTMLSLLGDCYSKRGAYDEAFSVFSTRNESMRRANAADYSVGRAITNAIGLIDYFTVSPPWPKKAPAEVRVEKAAGHIFLLGFMRSGTTLLESVMASNPKVQALDEMDFLRDPAMTYLGTDAGLGRLRDISEFDRTRLCESYWRNVRRQGLPLIGQHFLDKLPFNSVKLPLIAQLFPDAKIILALRDPRDVVLSAFRNRFALHTDSFEFLRLDDCARYYVATMELVQICREKLPLQVYDHRYERLVEDFDGAVKGVCEFTGIEWSDSMRKFEEAGVVDLRSVSAPQIQRGLYKGGAGQWRQFEKFMAPVLPILQPWVEKLGYEP